MQPLSRREFFAAAAAGAVFVAGELWLPSQKLISIPSGIRRFPYIERLANGWVRVAMSGDIFGSATMAMTLKPAGTSIIEVVRPHESAVFDLETCKVLSVNKKPEITPGELIRLDFDPLGPGESRVTHKGGPDILFA